MIKIGITGGIGSGKSVVASLLNLYGVPVYVADTESKLRPTRLLSLKKNSPHYWEKTSTQKKG